MPATEDDFPAEQIGLLLGLLEARPLHIHIKHSFNPKQLKEIKEIMATVQGLAALAAAAGQATALASAATALDTAADTTLPAATTLVNTPIAGDSDAAVDSYADTITSALATATTALADVTTKLGTLTAAVAAAEAAQNPPNPPAGGSLTLSPAAGVLAVTAGSSFSTQLTASGGDGTYSFTYEWGSVGPAPGFVAAADGFVDTSGVAVAANAEPVTYTLTATATDTTTPTPLTGTAVYTLTF